MSIVGKIENCSRCGDEIFLKRISIKNSATALGNIPPIEEFEGVHDGWFYNSLFGYLCPRCSYSLKRRIYEFYHNNEDVINPILQFNNAEKEIYKEENKNG